MQDRRERYAGGLVGPVLPCSGDPQGSSGHPRVNREGYTMAHMRHRANKALFANFAQTEFSAVAGY